MKIICFLFCLVLHLCLFSQKDYQLDTLFYSNDTLYEFITPNPKKGLTRNFNFTIYDLNLKNQDTTWFKQKEGNFNYKIVDINDTSFHTQIILDKRMWEDLLFSNDQIKEKKNEWEINSAPPIIIQTNRKGSKWFVQNCEEVYNFVLPFIQRQITFFEGHEDERIMTKILKKSVEKLEDCEYLANNVFGEIAFLNQLYTMPLPKTDTLAFRVTKTPYPENDENYKPGFSKSFKIIKEVLKNGNPKYLFGKDKEDRDSLMQQYMQDMIELFGEMDSVLRQEDIPITESIDKNIMILDNYNIPVKFVREMKSTMKRKNSGSLSHYIYKIEEID